MADPVISVCLATHRRPGPLEDCLRSLLCQRVPEGLTYEVVVTDNDPLGSASTIVDSLQRSTRVPLRYDREPERNIAHARNHGIRMARGSWVAFIDDDEVAAPTWLARLWECADTYHAAGVFGRMEPFYSSEVKPWIRKLRPHSLERPLTGSKRGFTRSTNNALFKKAALLTVRGPFDPRFGLTGGSDTRLFFDPALSEYPVVYCDEAVTYEAFGPERCTFSWWLRRRWRCGVVRAWVERETSTKSRRDLAAAWVRHLGHTWRLTLSHPPLPRWFTRMETVVFVAGHLFGIAGGPPPREYLTLNEWTPDGRAAPAQTEP